MGGESGAHTIGRPQPTSSISIRLYGVCGFGDGPVASSLNVMVPDLTRIASRYGGTLPADQVRRIIDGRAVQPPHGKRAMPVWGTDFRTAGASHVAGAACADELVGRLVEDVRSMRMKYSAGRSSCSVLRTKAIFVSVLVLDRSPSCQECSHACPMRGHIATNIHRR